jgi:hypothetical protein
VSATIPITLPPFPDPSKYGWGGPIANRWPYLIEDAMREYATAAVLADRQALLAKPVHLQGDGPFMKADVEAICALAVAAALKYWKSE